MDDLPLQPPPKPIVVCGQVTVFVKASVIYKYGPITMDKRLQTFLRFGPFIHIPLGTGFLCQTRRHHSPSCRRQHPTLRSLCRRIREDLKVYCPLILVSICFVESRCLQMSSCRLSFLAVSCRRTKNVVCTPYSFFITIWGRIMGYCHVPHFAKGHHKLRI